MDSEFKKRVFKALEAISTENRQARLKQAVLGYVKLEKHERCDSSVYVTANSTPCWSAYMTPKSI